MEDCVCGDVEAQRIKRKPHIFVRRGLWILRVDLEGVPTEFGYTTLALALNCAYFVMTGEFPNG